MKKLFLVSLCLLFAASILVSCARETPPAPQPNVQNPGKPAPPKEPVAPKDPVNQPPVEGVRTYFPLTLGSTWSYLGEGNEYASFTREVVFTQEDLAQIKENNGGTILSSVFRVTETTITRIFFQGETYEDKNFLNEPPNDHTVILTTPLEEGTLWNDDQGTRQIIDLQATVETPAGKFENCLVVEITSPTSTILEYYKEGVGMVKREFKSNGATVTSVLERYEIK